MKTTPTTCISGPCNTRLLPTPLNTVPLMYSNVYTLIALVRPHLEYGVTVWDPHLIEYIEFLEKVQRFALKVCTKSWNQPLRVVKTWVQY